MNHLYLCRPMVRRRSVPGLDGERDYIYQNVMSTKLASVTARTRRYATDEGEESRRWLQKQDFGQVPAYLQTWKAMLAEQHAKEQVFCTISNSNSLYDLRSCCQEE